MSTPTAARPKSETAAHWYTVKGDPLHEVPKADNKGMTPTTLRHARKMNLLPSVTNILRILHKEALVNWQIEQACLAILTAPRKPGEKDDEFVVRVLHVEEQQHEERNLAADRGSQIHEGMELLFKGQPVTAELEPWIRPAFEALCKFGQMAATEHILVGPGFAGRTDLIQDCADCWRLWDFKGSKKLPDPIKNGAWPEHRLQLAAYAEAWQLKLPDGQDKPIIVGNLYISTANQGEYVICEHENWEEAYWNGFRPLVEHWQWANQYEPQQPDLKPKRQAAEAQAEAPAPLPAAIPTPPPPAPTNGPEKIAGKKVVWTPGVRVPIAPTTSTQ
jgi:hypothetical protein